MSNAICRLITTTVLAVIIPTLTMAEADTTNVGMFMDRVSTWAKGSGSDAYYTSTNSATLAWGESYILRAFTSAYHATGDTNWLRRVATHADTIFANAKDVPEDMPYHASYADGYRGWGTIGYSDQYDEYIVHDGHVCAPIAEFAAIVYQDSTLWEAFGTQAQTHVAFLREHVAAKWIDRWENPNPSNGETYCLTARDWVGLDHVPHNQYAAFGLMLLFLDDVVRTPRYMDSQPGEVDQRYRDITVTMGEYFRSHIKTTSDGAFRWTYSLYSSDEDVSHANLELEFAWFLHEHGQVFSDDDMMSFGRTITNVMWNGDIDDPGISHNVSGSGDTEWTEYAWSWVLFGKHDPLVWYLYTRYFTLHDERASYANVAMARLQMHRSINLTKSAILPESALVGDDGDRVLRPGEPGVLAIGLRNVGYITDSVHVTLDDAAGLATETTPTSSWVTVEACSTAFARFGLQAPATVSTGLVPLTYTAGRFQMQASVATGNPRILVVEGAPPADGLDRGLFYKYLAEMPFRWIYEDKPSFSVSTLQQFDVVIWRSAFALPCSTDRDTLARYLDLGGKLMLTGGGSISRLQARTPADSAFLARYFMVTTARDIADSLSGAFASISAVSSVDFTGIGTTSYTLRTTSPAVHADVFETTVPQSMQTRITVTAIGSSESKTLPLSTLGVAVDSAYRAILLGLDLEDVQFFLNPAKILTSAVAWLRDPTSIETTTKTRTPTQLKINISPNPFNPVTRFRLTGVVPGNPLTMTIHNALGQRILLRTIAPSAAQIQITWNASDNRGHRNGSGVYVVTAVQGSRTVTRRVTLIR
jgi:hypothetical protein